MGLRWRKSFNRGPARVNLSRRGAGWSFGIPGLRFGVGADGVPYLSLGIPGSGLYYIHRFGPPRRRR